MSRERSVPSPSPSAASHIPSVAASLQGVPQIHMLSPCPCTVPPLHRADLRCENGVWLSKLSHKQALLFQSCSSSSHGLRPPCAGSWVFTLPSRPPISVAATILVLKRRLRGVSAARHPLDSASLVLDKQLKGSLSCPYNTWCASKAHPAAPASFPTPPPDTVMDLDGTGQESLGKNISC